MHSTLHIEDALAAWTLWPGGADPSADQRLAIYARLAQMQVHTPLPVLDYPGVIGPLLCNSADSQSAFRECCIELHNTQLEQNASLLPSPTSVERRSHLWDRLKASIRQPLFWLAIAALLAAFALGLGTLPLKSVDDSVDPPSTIGTAEPTSTQNDAAWVNTNKPGEPIRKPVLVGLRDNTPQIEVQVGQPWFLLLVPLLGAIATGLFSLLSMRQLQNFRTRVPTTTELIDKIDLSQLQPLFFSAGFDGRLSALQYRRTTSAELDVQGTISATVRSGFPNFVNRARLRRDELVLVHAVAHKGAWSNGYFAELERELVGHGVLVKRYTYRSTPSRLSTTGNKRRTVPLNEVIRTHSQANWVVFVAEESLVHPMTGKLFPWIGSLRSISRYSLAHSRLSAGVQQRLVAQFVTAHSLEGVAGFDSLIKHLSGARVLSIPNPHPEQPPAAVIELPFHLEELASAHRMYDPPPVDDIEKMIAWLKRTLPEDSFRLLCASVIYPKPDWRLTRILAERLAGCWYPREVLLNGSMSLLAPLLKLPWTQHTHFPEWFRLALIEEMPLEDERLLAGFFLDLLKKGSNKAAIDPLELSFDRPDWSITSWYEWARGNNPVKDALFATVLNRHRLAFRWMPVRIAKLIRSRHLALGSWGRLVLRGGLGAVAMSIPVFLLWWKVGAPMQQQRAVAQQCEANRSIEAISIRYTAELANEANNVARAFSAHCYNVRLSGIEPSPNNLNSTASDNILEVSEQQEVQLMRLSSHVLYELPIVTRLQDSDLPAQLTLTQPLLSGQVFRDRLPGSIVEARGELNETGEISLAPTTELADENARRGFSVSSPPAKSIDPVLPQMVLIEAGEFVMGSSRGDSDELPEHQVTLSSFELGETEVTWAEWRACELAGSCDVLDRPNWLEELEEETAQLHPVVNVSWNQVQQYINWLNQGTNRQYRLPSESEWEFAARAGTTTAFSTGQCISETEAQFDSSIPYEDCPTGKNNYTGTSAVAAFASNPWGLHDMHGNVWEWGQDCWNDNYTGAPVDGRAWLSGDCDQRVLRGGGWFGRPVFLRSAYRSRLHLDDGNSSVGFRLARTP